MISFEANIVLSEHKLNFYYVWFKFLTMDDTRDSFGIVSRCRFIPNGIKCLKIKHHLRLFIAVWHSCYVTIFNCIDEKNKALFKEQTVEKVCYK